MSRALSSKYGNHISLPRGEDSLAKVTRGLKKIRELPYCVGALDGTHMQWVSCLQEHYYEYLGYKGYTSVVIFVVATGDRRFIYADVGSPGVLEDRTIYERSALKKIIEDGS